ncbi:MAG: hypothetical protein CVT80_00675 [Alphaproteobacteria bacterium HGW-Alphaproteobacteria-2]|nr:MAG: hypothetical protein CVT80_00675 [Alphaproteobacteria bacterium HGW-Alphaproteobacteria-2]
MSMGLVLLVVLGAAGFFFARQLGFLGLIQTLGNPSRSRFRRSEPDGKTVFDVTPARPSRAALAAIAVGVIMLVNVSTLEIIAAFGLIPLAMGLLAFPIGARYRQPATMTISDGAVRSGNKSWPIGDIADINVRRGSRINADEPAQVVHRTPDGGLIYGSKSTSAMFSRVLNRRMIERSYLVRLRTRRESGEVVLSGGLTEDCARALAADLGKVIEVEREKLTTITVTG